MPTQAFLVEVLVFFPSLTLLTNSSTVLDGIAKPMPSTLLIMPEEETFSELMPMSCAWPFKSAPPLLPLLIAALVWM